MNVTEMNDRVLIRTYLESENKDSCDAVIIELISRGYEQVGEGIVFPKCNRKKKYVCAICEKTPWCQDYEPGGLGQGL